MHRLRVHLAPLLRGYDTCGTFQIVRTGTTAYCDWNDRLTHGLRGPFEMLLVDPHAETIQSAAWYQVGATCEKQHTRR
eukprot:9478450-Prorocentrum_lima.AAC.1